MRYNGVKEGKRENDMNTPMLSDRAFRAHKARGVLYTVISALLFGVTPVLASQTFDMGSNANTLTFYRNLLVVPVLLIVMLVKKIPFGLTKKELGLMLLVGVAFRASTTFMLYQSYAYISVGTATTLHFMYPMVTAVLCFVVFREKLKREKIAALVIALVGVMLFADKAGADAVPGLVLALASAVTYACYLTGMDKSDLRNMNGTKVACYMGLFNALAVLIVDQIPHQIVFVLPPRAMLYTFIIAMCTSFVAFWLLQRGIQVLGAPTAAIFCLFEPIGSVVSGALLLGERMNLRSALGCVCVLGAVLVTVLSDRKEKSPI